MASIGVAVISDLTLVVQEETELRVNSGVLMTTSVVFRTMLGPKYLEGQALSQHIDGTKSLPLPDDDPEGMKLLCAALHNRTDILPPTMPPATFERFSQLADKYACVDALRFAIQSYIGKFKYCEPDKFVHMINAAYLLNDAEAFSSFTNRLAKDKIIQPTFYINLQGLSGDYRTFESKISPRLTCLRADSRKSENSS